MANMKIQQIEGIGPAYGEKLRAAKIADTKTLLQVGSTKNGRKGIAQQTGINETQILKWVNMADLCRIKGVGQEFSELLECAGVDTVKELRNRNTANLTKAMVEANQQKKLTRRTPSHSEVDRWVAQAKELSPMVQY
ncbi:MAG: DUF4332 domain-containing protein [Gammaproteobacteria bacterium]|jgi:predicted flap endonuclease-1-like 5' DNA nuclease|nr:DUF4332 domain-containing protein [Gammaproteobacteria bacterium]